MRQIRHHVIYVPQRRKGAIDFEAAGMLLLQHFHNLLSAFHTRLLFPDGLFRQIIRSITVIIHELFDPPGKTKCPQLCAHGFKEAADDTDDRFRRIMCKYYIRFAYGNIFVYNALLDIAVIQNRPDSISAR